MENAADHQIALELDPWEADLSRENEISEWDACEFIVIAVRRRASRGVFQVASRSSAMTVSVGGRRGKAPLAFCGSKDYLILKAVMNEGGRRCLSFFGRVLEESIRWLWSLRGCGEYFCTRSTACMMVSSLRIALAIRV